MKNNSLLGYTKKETEEIFEQTVPVYLFQANIPNSLPKYKIVNRETEEEYTVEMARKELKRRGIL